MAVAVLVGLFLGAGAYAGTFREGGASAAGNPVANVGETAGGLVALRSGEPPHDDPANKPAPGEKPQVAEESLDVLVLGVDRRPESAEGRPTRTP